MLQKSSSCSSFRAVLFFLLTYAEMKALNLLKFLFSALVSKKEPLDKNCLKNRFFGTCIPANCLLAIAFVFSY